MPPGAMADSPQGAMPPAPPAWRARHSAEAAVRVPLPLRIATPQGPGRQSGHAGGAALGVGAALPAALAAGAAVAVRRRRRVAAHASSGDRLLHESLQREIGKINGGQRREADTARQGRSLQIPRRQVSGSGGWSGPGLGRLFEASRATRVPAASRLLALACLLPALAASMPYGAALFVQFRLLRELLLRPMLPLVQAYYGSRLTSMFAIAALYGLVAKNRSLHPFVRAVGLQASTLMMMQFPAGFLLQFFAPMPGPMLNLASGAVFLYFLYCILLAAGSCLTGAPARLPLIGDGQQLPWRPGGGGGFRSFRGSS
mmetsp:Transcript_159880/g.489083  ORF Transcript_159880/g.489083 Transcript_159880/m.489083 type:complete len:315 (-) Transcript_159880:290-1234(-)